MSAVPVSNAVIKSGGRVRHRRRRVDRQNGSGAVQLGAATFPARPVRLLLQHRMLHDGASLPEVAASVQIPLRTLHRVLHAERLSWTVADRCAVALGYHPCQLWPEWFADLGDFRDGPDRCLRAVVGGCHAQS
jgi:lambda repressor-like predicted transcriptional regulator